MKETEMMLISSDNISLSQISEANKFKKDPCF